MFSDHTNFKIILVKKHVIPYKSIAVRFGTNNNMT